jgi:hypothetical protein
MTIEVYTRSVDRLWRKMLRDSTSTVLVFSPYLTSPTAISVLKNADPARCQVHTVISVDSFVTGASSIETLRQLLDQGFPLFHVDNLHAKIVLVAGSEATIGSQNVTAAGVSKREATVAIRDSQRVADLERMVGPWIETRRPVTKDELAEIAQQIEPIRRRYHAIKREVRDAEKVIARNRESRRESERVLREQVAQVVERLSGYKGKQIPLSLAKELISGSIWWKDSPHGRVPAPGRIKQIETYDGIIALQFGRNRFEISRAISLCAQQSLRFIEELKKGSALSFLDFQRRLYEPVASAFIAPVSHRYCSYPIKDEGLKLGSQFINLREFTEIFLDKTGVRAILDAYNVPGGTGVKR